MLKPLCPYVFVLRPRKSTHFIVFVVRKHKFHIGQMCKKAGIAIGMMGLLCLFEAFERRNLLASVPFPGFEIDGQYCQK